MTLTRANVEAVLVKRVGAWLTVAGLDATTIDGTNVDLADPVAEAVLTLGGTVASYAAVTDTDIATLDTTDPRQLLDVAEVRTLYAVRGNLTAVDVELEGAKKARGQLATQLDKLIASREARVQQMYGIGVTPLTAGVLELNFQGNNDTSSNSFYPFN